LFAGAHGQALSNRVQPAADARLPPHRAGPPRQNEKRRLKRILGILMMTEDAPAHAPNQRCMPRHHRRKSILIVVVHEGMQQLTVAVLGSLSDDAESAQVVENGVNCSAGHG
jgi:hypothetical protein